MISPETNITDSLTLPADSLAATDSAAYVAEAKYGLLLTPEPHEEASPGRENNGPGVSFILSGLFLLALIIGLRYRDNVKHIVAIIHDLMATRLRQNAFDDTVRETSLLVLLNILWCASAGITGFCVLTDLNQGTGPISNPAVGMLWGMLIAAAYSVFLYLAYWTVGCVFSDRSHTELWMKGFAASQALMAPAFFITALLALCCPMQAYGIGIAAVVVFILGKLAFIFKGYRIFFNQFSSWVLFLCYLCSLEIVPLILCYRCAVLLG